MADIAFLAIIVAFFMLCVGYVSVCGRIIGPDEVAGIEPISDDEAPEPTLERAA